jgi:hypothetical protein
MGFYVIHPDGSKYGPAELSLLQKWVEENRIAETTLIEDEFTGISTPASLVPGLNFGVKPPSTGNPPPVQQAPPPPNPYATGPTYGGPSYGVPPYGEQQRGGYREHVDNHLVKAILATLCCCLAFGVVSIVYAAQVDGYANRGDYAGARDSAEKADTWANWAIGLGIISNALGVMVALAGGMSH